MRKSPHEPIFGMSDTRTRWFCLNSNGDLQYVGEFGDFDEADEHCQREICSRVWLFDEEEAHMWLEQLQSLLMEEKTGEQEVRMGNQ